MLAAGPLRRDQRKPSRAVRASALATAGLLLLLAEDARAWPEELRIDGGIGYERRLFGSPSFGTLSAGAALPLAGGALELAGGGRLAIGALRPVVGASGFVRASLCAVEGRWRPAVGLELEGTTATRAAPDPDLPSGSLERAYSERNRNAFLRAVLVVAPVRWQWRRLLAGLGSVRLATPLSGDLGRRVYLAIGIIDAGWVL